MKYSLYSQKKHTPHQQLRMTYKSFGNGCKPSNKLCSTKRTSSTL